MGPTLRTPGKWILRAGKFERSTDDTDGAVSLMHPNFFIDCTQSKPLVKLPLLCNHVTKTSGKQWRLSPLSFALGRGSDVWPYV